SLTTKAFKPGSHRIEISTDPLLVDMIRGFVVCPEKLPRHSIYHSHTPSRMSFFSAVINFKPLVAGVELAQMNMIQMTQVKRPHGLAVVVKGNSANNHLILAIIIDIANANGVGALPPQTLQLVQHVPGRTGCN